VVEFANFLEKTLTPLTLVISTLTSFTLDGILIDIELLAGFGATLKSIKLNSVPEVL
jgi:hypothetical protein